MNYNHIILTRFNLQYEETSTIHIDAQWLEERFRLFDCYCLPSITRQTTQAFTWVILACDQTPSPYRERLLQYAQQYNNIAIHFCAYQKDINQLYHTIGQQYCAGYTHLLSTRVDSDDMLAYDFVERLQAHITLQTKQQTILSFNHGIQWFEATDIALAATYKKNHFLSFYEPYDSLQTCIGIDHTKVPDTLLQVMPERGMWCEIVHSSNMCNSYVPKYCYRLSIPHRQYPIALTNANFIKQSGLLVREHIAFRLRQLRRLIKRIF